MDTLDDKTIDEMIATLSLHDDEWPNRAQLCLALIELRELRKSLESLRSHWLIRWFLD